MKNNIYIKKVNIYREEMPLWLKTLLKAIFITFIICCAFVAVFSFIYTHTTVEGKSMYPTLNNFAYTESGSELSNGEKDSVYINRFASYKKGDIVVFLDPDPTHPAQNRYVVKRLIATGGDKIAITESAIYIIEKGSHVIKQLEESYISNTASLFYAASDFNSYRSRESYKFETYGSLHFLELSENEVFLLGDNRANSTDSADYGAVEASKYVGRVDIIAYKSKDNFSYIFLYFWNKLFG